MRNKKRAIETSRYTRSNDTRQVRLITGKSRVQIQRDGIGQARSPIMRPRAKRRLVSST